MKFKYFKANHQTTIEDAKKQYINLCLKFHPDKGGTDEDMVAINAEFDYLKKHNYNIHEAANGSVYTDWQQDMPDDVTNEFADLISELVTMQGLEIEVCGSWLWVGGTTKDYKDSLKKLGMRWASKKRRWYKAPKDWKRKVHRELTMDEIRDKFGSQTLQTKQCAALTA